MSPQDRTWKHLQIRKSAPASLAIAILLTTNTFAQGIPPLTTGTNPVMGFESPNAWIVKSTSPTTTVGASTIRTEGSRALAVGNPSNPLSMTSAPVSSTTPALDGIDDAGAFLQVDVTPPGSNTTGTLKLAVSSASRGLKSEVVGEVELKGLNPGIYSTVRYSVPDAVRRALSGATFQDLSFEFVLSGAPAKAQFLFDNLRVLPAPTFSLKPGVKLPTTGGSVRLLATADAPAKQSFPIGSVQVPETFRLVAGVADKSKLKLTLSPDDATATVCGYEADSSDKTGESYRLVSCTGGVEGGDLVGASSAQLEIIGGDDTMKLAAQLALNPIGDRVGRNALPAMPTFWGHTDRCIPAPVVGAVHSVSNSCAQQVAESSQIVTDYFNKVKDTNTLGTGTTANAITAPISDRALRHGDALAIDSIFTPPPGTADVPFDKEGHANEGGDFDAYWKLKGDLNTKNNSTTGDSTTHFDADFSTHVVLFGDDVNVMNVNATVDTTSGTKPSATGSAHAFLFGVELPGGGSVDASKGLNFNLSKSHDFQLADQHYWIFELKVTATATVSLKTEGTLAASGFAITVTPEASLGTHIFGGVDIVVASGGVDAKINLLDVKMPITAQAGVGLNVAATSCSLNINFALKVDVTVSSLGGEIDLVATFGPCPFCDHESYTLVKWDPLLSTTKTLINVTPTTLAAIPMPTSICSPALRVTMSALQAPVTTGVTYHVTGQATSTNGAGTVQCADLKWAITPAEPFTVSGCQISLQFNNAGAHTLSLKASESVVDQFDRTITESGTASGTVSVGNLPAGAYIMAVNPSPVVDKQAPFNNQALEFRVRNFPAAIQITGKLVGPAANGNISWSVSDASHGTTVISASPCAAPACVAGPDGQQTVKWTVPAAGTYTIKVTSTDSTGKVIATASMSAAVAKTSTIPPLGR